MSKHHVLRITDTLTADAICRRLDVSTHSVRSARTKGVFPASWYGELRQMCESAGISCPLSAFNWREPEAQPENSGDNRAYTA